MRKISIDKDIFAVGLNWLSKPAEKKKFKLKAALMAEAKELKANCIIFSNQKCGLGSENVNRKVKIRSLAASINITTNFFLGLFKLEDINGEQFWWIYAIKDGLISAKGDNIFLTREEAEHHIVELSALLGKFEKIVMCENHHDSLNWLMPNLKKVNIFEPSKNYLTSISDINNSGINKIIQIVMILAVLTCGFYLFNMLLDYQSSKKAIESARIALIDKEKRKQELLAKPEQHFDQVWNQKLPASSMSLCIDKLFEVPLSINGWSLKAANCSNSELLIELTHSIGANYTDLPVGAILLNPNQANLRTKFIMPANKTSKINYKQLLHRSLILKDLYQTAQNLGVKLKLSFSAPEQKKIDGIEITAPFVSGKFELTEIPEQTLLDYSVLNALEMVGLSVSSINLSTNWTIRGDIYAKN